MYKLFINKELTLVFLAIILSQICFAQLNINSFIFRGKNDISNQQYSSAINNFNKIIKVKPELVEPYFLRGIAKYNLGDFRGADSDFTKVIELNPFFADAYHYKGVTKNMLNDYSSAIENYNKAIEYAPNNEKIYVSIGITQNMLKQYENALENLNKAIKINKSLPSAYMVRGITKTALKKYDEAIDDFTEAIKLNPLSAEYYAKRGWAKYENEEYRKAISDFNQAIKIDIKNVVSYYLRALSKYKIIDYTGAMSDYDKVIELNPKNSIAYYNRAILKSEIGAYNKAIDDYNKVAELKPDNILTYYNRAGVKIKIDDFNGAIEDYSKAIDIYPDFASAYLNRSVAKKRINDLKGAIEDYNEGINRINQYKNSGELNLSDTSENFQKIVELDSDFEAQLKPGEIFAGRIQDIEVIIELAENYSIQISSINSSDVELQSYYSSLLEELNDKLKKTIKLQLSKSKVNYNLDSVLNYIEKAEKNVMNNPDNVQYLFLQGILQHTIQNYNKSIINFNKVIQQEPDFILAYFIRANIMDEMNEFINSFNDNYDIISLNNISNSKSNISSDIYNKDIILSDYNKAIELDSNFVFALYNRANFKCKTADYWGAISDYSIVINKNHDFAEAYYNRGLTLIYLNDIQKACIDLSKSGELGIKPAYNVIKRYCRE